MGSVRKSTKHRRWTQEEEEKLRNLSERMTKTQLAKALKRTQSSVNTKRNRLGIPCFAEQTDLLNGTEIAQLVGVHSTSIYKTWVSKGLSMKKIGYCLLASEKELVRFMQEQPQLWKASKCDYYFFCRYEWFLERLKKERAGEDNGNRYTNTRRWTEKEISRAKMLKSKGLTHKEIGKELGRTKGSIDHLSMRGRI